MGRSQRTKGKRGERAVKLLFQERDWDVHQRPRGESGDDFTVYDKNGKRYSVEVKCTRSLNHSMWAQCKRNAGKHDRILAWHPSGWDFAADYWVLFIWRKGEPAKVCAWKSNGIDLDVEEEDDE